MRIGEDLDTFIYDLEVLYTRAWPDHEEDVRSGQLMDQLVEGLTPQLRQKVLEKDPEDYLSIITFVRRLVLADIEGQLAGPSVAQVTSRVESSKLASLRDQVAELTRTVSQLNFPEKQRERSTGRGSQTAMGTRRSILEFWRCGAQGHLQRDCTIEMRPSAKGQQRWPRQSNATRQREQPTGGYYRRDAGYRDDDRPLNANRLAPRTGGQL